MEKAVLDIILLPALLLLVMQRDMQTYTSSGTLLLFRAMNTRCIHVIHETFFICELLSFSTQYLPTEKQAGGYTSLSIQPLTRDEQGFKPR